MKVAELAAAAQNHPSRFVPAELGAVTYEEDILSLPDGTRLTLDEQGIDALAKHLNAPGPYLRRVSEELRVANFQYWLETHSGHESMFEVSGGDLVGVFNGEDQIIPRDRIYEAIAEVMDPDDEVRSVNLEDGLAQVDVSSFRLTVEPRVDDVTEAGLRFRLHVSPKHMKGKPYVATYLYRLVCSNGALHQEEGGRIRVKGASVEDILQEAVEAGRGLLANVLPERLDQLSALTNVTVENVEQFVHRLSREFHLSSRMETGILEHVPEIEEHTMYDVVQLITERQHEVSSEVVRTRLAEVGGSLIARSGDHRCAQCHSLLG